MEWPSYPVNPVPVLVEKTEGAASHSFSPFGAFPHKESLDVSDPRTVPPGFSILSGSGNYFPIVLESGTWGSRRLAFNELQGREV